MPFTPYHFGPGLLLKAAFPTRVSATAFAAAQVAVDLEPAYWMFVARESPVHRSFHTFPVAAALGLAAGAAVAALGAAGRRSLAASPPAVRSEFAPAAALLVGLAGALLHVATDATVYPSLRPFAPFSGANPFFGHLCFDRIQTILAVAGIFGVLILAVRTDLWTPGSTSARETPPRSPPGEPDPAKGTPGSTPCSNDRAEETS